MGLVTAAAVVTATAAVAGAGLQAAKAAGAFDGGGPGSPAYVPPTQGEIQFNRGTKAILDLERRVLDDALSQGKLLEPEMYRALGLEPIYDREVDPEVAGVSNQLAGTQRRLDEVQLGISDLKGTRTRKGRERKQKRRELRALTRERKKLKRDVETLTQNLERSGAVGRRVIGFKPLEGVADPTGSTGGSFGAALDDFNQGLSRALSGKEPIDPTLKTAFEERERNLRERLRRQLGPDFETSTAGARAMSDFAREKAEAFAQFNRESISEFSRLAEGRAAALSGLTGERLRNLMLPAAFRRDLGKSLEGLAAERRQFAQGPVQERRAQESAIEAERAREQAERDARFDALLGATSSLGAGTSSGLTTLAEQLAANKKDTKTDTPATPTRSTASDATFGGRQPGL